MDNKFFVSYEAARLLKEKGYDDEYINFYNENGELIIPYDKEEYHILYPCPTKAEAIDWLDRKIHIGIGYDDLHSKWHYDITPVRPGTKSINNLSFSTRLEAEEAAIIEACELLENGN